MPGALRPWRKVAVVALIGTAVIGWRDGVGYVGAKVSGTNDCRVTSVVDGDTVRVYCPGQGFDRVRLVGFDAPEVFSPGCASEGWAGAKATVALQGALWGAERETLAFRAGRDRYGRRLAVLRLDGTDVARTMIAAGHARAYRGGRRQGWCG